ncbi:MAG: glycosyltransferase family protein [Acidobacteriota bacterium]
MRALFYSHDSYGLGHIRRTLVLAERLLGDNPRASGLVLTGAPRASWLTYPARCDFVKLPSVTKDEDGRYVPLEPGERLEETIGLRQRLIEGAATFFAPDVLFADHVAAGLCGELLPLLERMQRTAPSTLRVLGMRDVIDEPQKVRRAFRASGTLDVIRRHYDRVLVYGTPEIFDPVREYSLPADVAEKLVFAGYLPRNGARTAPEAIRARYAPRTGRLVAVTAGGGGDGLPLMRAALRGYRALGPGAPFELLLVTGPLLSPRKRRRLQARAAGIEGLTVVEHERDLPAVYRAAEFVIGMAGYNAVCEMACAGVRALLVPRVFPRREQAIRAGRLAARGVVRVLDPAEATPERLMHEVLAGLDAPAPPRGWGLPFTALEVVSAQIGHDLAQRRPATPLVARHRRTGRPEARP